MARGVAIGERDLARELVAERRLVAAARQERRGERCGRTLENHAAMNGHESPRWRRRPLVAEDLGGFGRDERREVIEEPRREFAGLFRAPFPRERREGALDLAAEVPSKGDVGIHFAEFLDDMRGGRRFEIARELFGDDMLIDALDERSPGDAVLAPRHHRSS